MEKTRWILVWSRKTVPKICTHQKCYDLVCCLSRVFWLSFQDPPAKENPYEDIETNSRCLGKKCVLNFPASPSSSVPGTPTKVSRSNQSDSSVQCLKVICFGWHCWEGGGEKDDVGQRMKLMIHSLMWFLILDWLHDRISFLFADLGDLKGNYLSLQNPDGFLEGQGMMHFHLSSTSSC